MVVEDQSNCCISLSIAENASDDACYGAGIKVYLFLTKTSSVMTRLFNLLILSSGFHLKKETEIVLYLGTFFFFPKIIFGYYTNILILIIIIPLIVLLY